MSYRHRAAMASIITGALLFASGCSTYSTLGYSSDTETALELRDLSSEHPNLRLSVGEFGMIGGEDRSSYNCRAVGPLLTPDGNTYPEYVRRAFVDELRLAGLYETLAPLEVEVGFHDIQPSSAAGFWAISAQVTVNGVDPFDVEIERRFTTSWYGETACNQTAQAFMPAVQDFVRAVVRHPQFQAALASA
jgi:hypothetical protein